MEYTLLKKITITRPILFLCGPYYEQSNRSDRRVILQNMLYDTYKNKYLPLVIDDFLTEKNIRDDNISIQIMEEICAAVSFKTYIFLDTISSATELGIFANSAYINEIQVFIPKVSDIYNRKNVGYFVHDVVMKKHSDRVKCLEYRPGLERKAIATDYVVEHYKFVNDKLPLNIEANIKEDPIFKQDDTHAIHIMNEDTMPGTPYRICYQRKGASLTVNLSVRLLFYVTVSVILSEYKDFLNDKDEDFTKLDIGWIMENVNQCIKNFIAGEKGEDLTGCSDVKLHTVLKTDERNLIYHIAKFVHVYYLYSRFHRYFLLEKPLGNVIDRITVGAHPYTIFGLDEEKTQLLEEITADKEKYFEKIVIRKNRKKREIVKYRDDENGERARELHNHMLKSMQKCYLPNDASFAYRKGRGIKQCAERHLKGNEFLKYDIKKFFNSIKPEKLVKCIAEKLCIDKRFLNELHKVLDTCFYEGILPLGLVLSPILSDIYMNEFDCRMTAQLESKGMIYTRYADDILISRSRTIGVRMRRDIDKFVISELRRLSLYLNRDKMMKVTFLENGNYIRYVGLNIVCAEEGNFISVGKAYAYNVAKDYLNYITKVHSLNSLKLEEDKEELQRDIFYERLIIIGKLGFLRQIEGEKGIDKVRARLRAHNVSIENI